jgi:glycosyltransferase involved in cell wall biosynthesis
MNIDVYAICWNEADMLGFFFKHYDKIATRYIIFDDGSTDGSLDILRNHPKVEVRALPPRIDDSHVLTAREIHNEAWKESRGRADWVVITAIDEHLFHDDLGSFLSRCLDAGITLIPAVGYQMVSDVFPEPEAVLVDAVTKGAPFSKMSKLCVFQPDAIVETGFKVGRHSAVPEGNVNVPAQDELLNLHFKYLDFERLLARHHVLAGGLGATDMKRGWGHRYFFEREKLQKDWDGFAGHAIDLQAVGVDCIEAHGGARWWREKNGQYNEITVASKT